MPGEILDDKVYISAYVGMGKEGRSISDTLRAAARKKGQSLSLFVIQAALDKAKADTQKSKADTQVRIPLSAIEKSGEVDQAYPKPSGTPKQPLKSPVPARSNDSMIPIPIIETPPPSSKPPPDDPLSNL